MSDTYGRITRLVREFEFSMNWSTYSRYVDGVFGATPATGGLAAFVLQATFLGRWLVEWDRLPKRVQLEATWRA
jgi:cytochrome bd-type quinol oxidase subunit 1